MTGGAGSGGADGAGVGGGEGSGRGQDRGATTDFVSAASIFAMGAIGIVVIEQFLQQLRKDQRQHGPLHGSGIRKSWSLTVAVEEWMQSRNSSSSSSSTNEEDGGCEKGPAEGSEQQDTTTAPGDGLDGAGAAGQLDSGAADELQNRSVTFLSPPELQSTVPYQPDDKDELKRMSFRTRKRLSRRESSHLRDVTLSQLIDPPPTSARKDSRRLDAYIDIPEAHEVFGMMATVEDKVPQINKEKWCQVLRSMDLEMGDPEISRLFELIDTDRSGKISFDEYWKAVHEHNLLRVIHKENLHQQHRDKAVFTIPPDYDWTKPTNANHAQANQPGFKGDPTFVGLYKDIRESLIDTSYHPIPTAARQHWQDHVIRDLVGEVHECECTPWLVYTCGPMGAGKGYALAWMVRSGYLPLDNPVHVDPDHFKSIMPEFQGYNEHGQEAGTMCHQESGMMAEIAQEVAMRRGLNVWVDGSLRNGHYYRTVFQRIHEEFPEYSIAIFEIQASEANVRRRIKDRAERTGRDIPDEALKASLRGVGESLHILTPMVDFLARINNDGTTPELVSYECIDRVGTFEVVRNRFSKSARRFPNALPPMYVVPTQLDMACVDLGSCNFDNPTSKIHCNFAHDQCGHLRKLLQAQGVGPPYLCEMLLHKRCPVNVPDDIKCQLLIPHNAVHFAHCSPMLSDASTNRAHQIDMQHPDICFCLYGGYFYFDGNGRLLQINAIGGFRVDMPSWLTKKEGTLCQRRSIMQFGVPDSIPHKVAERLEQEGRFYRTRLNRICHYNNRHHDGHIMEHTWINPLEIIPYDDVYYDGLDGSRSFRDLSSSRSFGQSSVSDMLIYRAPKFGGFLFKFYNGMNELVHVLYPIAG